MSDAWPSARRARHEEQKRLFFAFECEREDLRKVTEMNGPVAALWAHGERQTWVGDLIVTIRVVTRGGSR